MVWRTFFEKNCIGFSHKTHRLFQEPRLGLYSFWWACSVYFCSLFLWYPVYCKGGEEGRRVFRRCLRKGQMDSGFDFSFSLLGYCGIQIFLTCPLGLIHLIPYSQLTAVATDAGPHSFLLYTSTLFLFLGWIRRPSGLFLPLLSPLFPFSLHDFSPSLLWWHWHYQSSSGIVVLYLLYSVPSSPFYLLPSFSHFLS